MADYATEYRGWVRQLQRDANHKYSSPKRIAAREQLKFMEDHNLLSPAGVNPRSSPANDEERIAMGNHVLTVGR